MFALIIAAAVVAIVLADRLWAWTTPKPTVLVPRTGIELPPTVSAKPTPPLRNQIVNLKWRINQ
jgi:hypothetical protein